MRSSSSRAAGSCELRPTTTSRSGAGRSSRREWSPTIAATPLLAACEALTEHWSPKVVGRVNDSYVKVAKLLGEFVWHRHEHEDELFLVLSGTLEIRYADRSVTLNAGEFAVVPKNVLHQPVAHEECCIALIEPVATRHTGDTVSPMTRTIAQQLSRAPLSLRERGRG